MILPAWSPARSSVSTRRDQPRHGDRGRTAPSSIADGAAHGRRRARVLAVIAVVCVTLGKADRTTSTAAQVQQRVEDRPSAGRRYQFTSVIGQDVLTSTPERIARGGGTPTFRQEASGSPDCDPLRDLSALVRCSRATISFNPWAPCFLHCPPTDPPVAGASDPWLARVHTRLDERDNLSRFRVPIREDESG